METTDPLAEYRREIDECDREIVRLLHRRAAAAIGIGRHKQANGQPFYDASRQKEVLRRVVEHASGGAFPAEGLRNVFSEIMSSCLNLERPIRVGYLGPAGTFSHMAAITEFGSTPELKPYPNFSDIFDAVERDWIDYGVVPVENSTNGMVHYVLDLLMNHDLIINTEILMGIHHCLLSRAAMKDIARIYSHQQGLQQCQIWLRRNLPGVDHVEVGSTAMGVQRALDDPQGAAIGSALAARLHDINILAANIEDMKDNFTRFLTLARRESAPSPHDKTSIIFSVADRPGALFEMLRHFNDSGVNLTKIESRPSRRRAWDYVFFVDMIGGHQEPHIHTVMDRIKAGSSFFKFLGSYPRDLAPREAQGSIEPLSEES